MALRTVSVDKDITIMQQQQQLLQQDVQW